MVKFLNKDAAYAAIVEIVNKADRKLVLICPYMTRIPDDLLQRLKHKDKQGIKTIVVCREKDSGKDLASEVRSELKELRNLELLFDDDLHAKCFYNEKSMVITSLNLHEASARKNREMGVLLSSEEDSSVFNEALEEAEYIIGGAKKDSTLKSFANRVLKEINSAIDLPTQNTSMKVRSSSRTKQKGYCIRCGKNKTYDLDAPYCPDCYRVWNKFKDPDYKEEFCHLCGTPNQPTTMNKPLCNSCYNKSLRK
jgi:phosphatidylserine/phosphatidylglycerophosphate/cardiolipin synthase-like enzyme